MNIWWLKPKSRVRLRKRHQLFNRKNKDKNPTRTGIFLWHFQFIVTGISSQLETSSLRKLVSYGGLDLTIHCLAPFEISVLGGRIPAFISETDLRKPRWKRREGQDLPCVLLPLTIGSTTNWSPSVGWDCRVYGPDDPWENAMCDFKGRNSAVILLGNSMCIVFVGGEPELGNREGLMKHTVQKSIIQNCNKILKTLMLMHQLVNLV